MLGQDCLPGVELCPGKAASPPLLLPFSGMFSSLLEEVGARQYTADDPRRGLLSTHKHDVYWLWDGSERDLETQSLVHGSELPLQVSYPLC